MHKIQGPYPNNSFEYEDSNADFILADYVLVYQRESLEQFLAEKWLRVSRN